MTPFDGPPRPARGTFPFPHRTLAEPRYREQCLPIEMRRGQTLIWAVFDTFTQEWATTTAMLRAKAQHEADKLNRTYD